MWPSPIYVSRSLRYLVLLACAYQVKPVAGFQVGGKGGGLRSGT